MDKDFNDAIVKIHRREMKKDAIELIVKIVVIIFVVSIIKMIGVA